MNTVNLIGRLAELPQTDESGLRTTIKLEIASEDDGSVNRESVIIPVCIWRGMGDILTEKSHVGDLIGIKGSLETVSGQLRLTAERVSLITEK